LEAEVADTTTNNLVSSMVNRSQLLGQLVHTVTWIAGKLACTADWKSVQAQVRAATNSIAMIFEEGTRGRCQAASDLIAASSVTVRDSLETSALYESIFWANFMVPALLNISYDGTQFGRTVRACRAAVLKMTPSIISRKFSDMDAELSSLEKRRKDNFFEMMNTCKSLASKVPTWWAAADSKCFEELNQMRGLLGDAGECMAAWSIVVKEFQVFVQSPEEFARLALAAEADKKKKQKPENESSKRLKVGAPGALPAELVPEEIIIEEEPAAAMDVDLEEKEEEDDAGVAAAEALVGGPTLEMMLGLPEACRGLDRVAGLVA